MPPGVPLFSCSLAGGAGSARCTPGKEGHGPLCTHPAGSLRSRVATKQAAYQTEHAGTTAPGGGDP